MSKDKHSRINRERVETLTASNDGKQAAIELLKETLENMESSPAYPEDLIDRVDVMTSMAKSFADGMIQLRAELRAAAGLAIGKKIGKPIFVYRYKDDDEKVGYVPADEENAELKARRLDADGLFEFGYAFRKKDGKYTGFVLVQSVGDDADDESS